MHEFLIEILNSKHFFNEAQDLEIPDITIFISTQIKIHKIMVTPTKW